MVFFSSDQTHLAREKAKADAEYYKTQKVADANKVSTQDYPF